jgi:hydrogen peroxide-dependent heme synthase
MTQSHEAGADDLIFTSYPVFKAIPDQLSESERDVAVKEIRDLFEDHREQVEVRGLYSTAGLTAGADVVMWWVASTPDDLQHLTGAFMRTRMGRSLEATEIFFGLVRPAEFAKNHLPAFVQGKPPKKYLCVYPFVRTPEWYLLPAEERGRLLREHGEAGREYPDVLANTTSAFGLGDYEWILAFEADGLERIVQLIRRLRATEARRYTKVEVPFFTGIRKNLDELVAALP